MHRQNLKVLEHATVCRIMQDRTSRTAHGVEFIYIGEIHQAFANEIILSAGSIGSLQLLEFSGIRDPDILRKAGVQSLIDLPEVGNNLQDHPMTSLTYAFNGKRCSSSELNLCKYRQGLEKSDGVSLMAFLSYPSLVSPTELAKTISQVNTYASLAKPEREAIIARLQGSSSGCLQFNGAPAYIDIGNGHANQRKLIRTSRGTNILITATISLSPAPYPVEALTSHLPIRVMERVVPSPDVDLKDRNQARQFICDWTTSFNHILGTCGMGRVVDERLRVKGMRGLGVVDASVISTMVSGNVMATVYAVAEKASDMVKEDFHTSGKFHESSGLVV
ncbi:unnamed protein product [Penicillium egyptiacum]|uniref:Glucose-methanol-choline oxidoreductase N-terminal domain-containing protein n=1 Tax=Penicillium egyptiacum TaxID=1303716 RepID=A0A9W4KR20_9EURO|nr:unnamed protein product [Penicillium egyptiacum]